MAASSDYQTFVRRLHRVEENIRAMSTPQLVHSSIEDGSVNEYDAAGALVGVVGKQFDGTHGAVAFQGPRPPTPSTPTAEGGPGTLTAVWDGGFTGGAARPLDLHFVRATAVNTATGESSPMGTTVASGPIVASLPPGTYDVTLSAESMPGLTSRYPSAAATAVVTELVDQQAITDELAAADQRLTDARTALEQADQQLTDALAGTDQSVAAIPGKIETAKQEAIDAPTKLEQLVVGQNVIPDSVVDELFARVVKARTVTATEAFIGANAILTGAITAPKITASEELWAKIANFGKVNAQMLTADAIDGKLITGPVIRTAATGRRVQIDTVGIRAYNAQNVETMRVDGVENLLSGKLTTNLPGEPGIILFPTTSLGKPGIWFSQTGSGDSNQAAIYVDEYWQLHIRSNVVNGSKTGVIFDTGVNILTGDLSANDRKWQLKGDGTFYATRTDTSDLYLFNPPTSTFGANVGIASSPKDRFYKLTSNAKYKLSIQEQTLDVAKRILDVPAVTWFDKFQAEAYADHLAGNGPDLDDIAHLRRIPGVTAQDVLAAGLDDYVTYDHDGKLEGVSYDRLWTLLILLVKDLYTNHGRH